MSYLFFTILFPFLLLAKQTICLNMIVKNEKPVLLKCLESVKPLIDYWMICDAGSTDGTQEAIRSFLKDIPGELHERPWKGFAHNRNEALELARNKADRDERLRSLFQIGILQQRLQKSPDIFLKSYERAFSYDSSRAEPLFHMAGHYIEKRDFKKAYLLLKKATQPPLPEKKSFLERSIYTWAALYNLAICTENVHYEEETKLLLQKLLQAPELPEAYRELTRQRFLNLKF
jgi:glycosyltransferase involved in cell wall biosynthesis